MLRTEQRLLSRLGSRINHVRLAKETVEEKTLHRTRYGEAAEMDMGDLGSSMARHQVPDVHWSRCPGHWSDHCFFSNFGCNEACHHRFAINLGA